MTAACCLLFGVNAKAIVHKCVDENETTHYQNTACKENIEVEIINVSGEHDAVDNDARKRQQSYKLAALPNSRYNRVISKIDSMEQHKKECKQLRLQYEIAQQEVVKKCKKTEIFIVTSLLIKLSRRS